MKTQCEQTNKHANSQGSKQTRNKYAHEPTNVITRAAALLV